MDHLIDDRAHPYFTFYEANILIENLRYQDKSGFLSRLRILSQHTADTVLLRELEHLTTKIINLSEQEFSLLRNDTLQGTVLFPPNYRLPKLTE